MIFAAEFRQNAAPPPPKQHLESTQDLLARFHLLSAYDRYVRPFVSPVDDASLANDPNAPASAGSPTRSAADHHPALAGHSAGLGASASGVDGPGVLRLDKGKGKERERDAGAAVGTPGADGADAPDGEDDDGMGGGGKGEKKKKNSYKNLIKGVPGTSGLLDCGGLL